MTQTPTAPVTGARCDEERAEFLLEVYRQTSAHLGHHTSGDRRPEHDQLRDQT